MRSPASSTWLHFVPRPDDRPVTKFERRGERLGHDIFDLAYRPAR